MGELCSGEKSSRGERTGPLATQAKSFKIYFLIPFYLVITDSGELTYTLSEAMEKIGFGKFQLRILLMVGFFMVSMFNMRNILATLCQVQKCLTGRKEVRIVL